MGYKPEFYCDEKWIKVLKLFTLFIVWFGSSLFAGFLEKILFLEFPFPITCSWNALLITTILSAPLLFRRIRIHFFKKPGDEAGNPESESENMLKTTQVFNAKQVALLSLINVCHRTCALITIWKFAMSYAYTLKSLGPLFTVVFSFLIYRETPSLGVFLSLIPIMLGVGLATLTESSLNYSFDYLPLLAGFGDTSSITLNNILFKRYLERAGISSIEGVAITSLPALIFMTPLWAAIDLKSLHIFMEEERNWWRICLILMGIGLLNFVQTVTSTMVVASFSILSCAVANSFRRISIIGLSFLVFKNPASALNITGIVLACAGMFSYSLSKAKATGKDIHKEEDEEKKPQDAVAEIEQGISKPKSSDLSISTSTSVTTIEGVQSKPIDFHVENTKGNKSTK